MLDMNEVDRFDFSFLSLGKCCCDGSATDWRFWLARSSDSYAQV